MIKEIGRFFNRFFSSEEKRTVAQNFLSLSILQVANYILPIITLPYLVRVLGPEKFGLIAFAQAVVQYFHIVTDYGFIFSATKAVSLNRDDPEKIAKIFSAVTFIKILFLTACAACLGVIIMLFAKFRTDWLVYCYSFGMAIGYTIFPTWFFQGMERMKYVTILNIIGKLIFTVLIFIFVKKQGDYLYVPLIMSTGFMLVGLMGMIAVFRDFNVRLERIGYSDIKEQLDEGWHTFVSLTAVAMYTNTNVFMLGIFTNNTLVGYYSAAEKMLFAAQKIIGAISQSVFPYVSKLASVSRKRASAFLKKLIVLAGASFFFISAAILIFAEPIVNILLGPRYHESVTILRVFAFIPFIVMISNTFIVQGLYAFGHQNVASRYIGAASLVYLPVMALATYYFHAVGTAVSFLFMEMVIAVLSRHYYFKVIEDYTD